MNPIAKTLLFIGIACIVLALIWQVGGRWLGHLGKLPGDIVIKKDNFSFYFPIVTCILISVLLTLASLLWNYFRK
jgi:formate hydrogenlyase subunit 3/multisubunit Na+/H+ antiporter MnhD subunit